MRSAWASTRPISGSSFISAFPVRSRRTSKNPGPAAGMAIPASADFPAVPESPLPPPDRRRRFKRGQKVAVPQYGDGEIRGVDGDKIEVAFGDGQVRKFKRDFLRHGT